MKVKNIVYTPVRGEKTVDFYVPVSIEYPQNKSKHQKVCYYQHINKTNSFVEITVNSATGKIIGITVVSINKLNRPDERLEKAASIRPVSGNPELDMSAFENVHIITDDRDFSIQIKDRELFIFCSQYEIRSKIKMDDLDILIDGQNHIAGYIFHGFTAYEWSEMSAGLARSGLLEKY